MPPWLLWIGKMLLLTIIQIAAYALMPKPKGPKPDEFKDLESPKAEAGKPIPVVFGEVILSEWNLLWSGDIETVTSEVDASSSSED